MTRTYNWTFSQLDVRPAYNGLSNVVKTVHWRYSVVDEAGQSVTRYGTIDLSDPILESFVEYGNLTKEIVISWIETIIDMVDLKQKIDGDLDRITNPIVQTMDPPFQN